MCVTQPRVADELSNLPAAIGPCVAIGVAALLVPFRDWLGSSNVALILAIVVVVAATFGGRLAGVLTSVAAALAFDFFHTRPYLTLRIDRRVDIIAGARSCSCSGWWWASSPRCAKRMWPLPAVTSAARPTWRTWRRSSPPERMREVWPVVKRSLVEQLDLAECRFEPAPFEGHLTDLTRTGRVDTELLHYEAGGFTLPAEGVEVPVSHGGHVLGRLVLVPQPHRGHDVTAAARGRRHRRPVRSCPGPYPTDREAELKGPPVADIVFIAIVVAFFALCVGYVRVCDRIIGPDPSTERRVDPPTDGVERNVDVEMSDA